MMMKSKSKKEMEIKNNPKKLKVLHLTRANKIPAEDLPFRKIKNGVKMENA